MIQERVKDIAKSYVGQKETPNNSGFENADFQKKMEDMGWEKGEAWCASFAKLVFSEAYLDKPSQLAEIEQLFSKSAVQTYKNFDNSDWKTQNADGSPIMTPVVGALAVWKMGNGPAGHIGVVSQVCSCNEGSFQTVEGNTNDDGSREGVEVATRCRKVSRNFNTRGLNLLGFILPKDLPKAVTNVGKTAKLPK